MARGPAVHSIPLLCCVGLAVLSAFPVSSIATTYWKQALVEARYSGNAAKALAAFYSTNSLVPSTSSSTASGKVIYQLVHDWSSPDLCSSASTGDRDPSNATISLANKPFAVLAHIDNCSIDVKVSEAISLGASVLVLYDNSGPVGTRSLLANSNPLRIESSSSSTLQTIGISINDGDDIYSALQQGLTQGQAVTLTIWPRPDHESSVLQMEGMMYFQLCVSMLVVTTLSGILVVYRQLYVQTRRMTLSQRSRADEARDILETLPERTLDESIIEDDDHVMCVVCIDNLETGDTIRTLPCNSRHRFHKDCIDRWLVSRQTCPLCKYNILSGMIEDEEEMDVQDAAAEIARGHLPNSVLGQAAALPLPPSRLSLFLDSSRPQHDHTDASPSPSLPNMSLSRLLRARSFTPDVANESLTSNVILLDYTSPTLLPSIGEHDSFDGGATMTVPDASQSSLSSRSIVLRPDVASRPRSRRAWMIPFSSHRDGHEIRPRNQARSQPSTNRSPLAAFTRMFASSLGHRQVANDAERQPLSNCSNDDGGCRDTVQMV